MSLTFITSDTGILWQFDCLVSYDLMILSIYTGAVILTAIHHIYVHNNTHKFEDTSSNLIKGEPETRQEDMQTETN